MVEHFVLFAVAGCCYVEKCDGTKVYLPRAHCHCGQTLNWGWLKTALCYVHNVLACDLQGLNIDIVCTIIYTIITAVLWAWPADQHRASVVWYCVAVRSCSMLCSECNWCHFSVQT